MIEKYHLYNTAQVEWDDFTLASNVTQYDGYIISPEEATADAFLTAIQCWEEDSCEQEQQENNGLTKPLRDENEQPCTIYYTNYNNNKTRRRRFCERNKAALQHADELIQNMMDLEMSLNGRGPVAEHSMKRQSFKSKKRQEISPTKQSDSYVPPQSTTRSSLIETPEAWDIALFEKQIEERDDSYDSSSTDQPQSQSRPLHDYVAPFTEPNPFVDSRLLNRYQSSQHPRRRQEKPSTPTAGSRMSPVGVSEQRGLQNQKFDRQEERCTPKRCSQREYPQPIPGTYHRGNVETAERPPCPDKVEDFLARSRSVIANAQRIRQETAKQIVMDGINAVSMEAESEVRFKMSASCRQRIREARAKRLSKEAGVAKKADEFCAVEEKKAGTRKVATTKQGRSFRSPQISGWRSFGVLDGSDSSLSSN